MTPSGNSTNIRLEVSPPDPSDGGRRRGLLSIRVPRLDTGSGGDPRYHPWRPWGPINATFELLPQETEVDLRVLVDRSIVEAFAANGRAALTVRDFPAPQETNIYLWAGGDFSEEERPSGSSMGNRSSSSSAAAVVLKRGVVWEMGCGWTAEESQGK